MLIGLKSSLEFFEPFFKIGGNISQFENWWKGSSVVPSLIIFVGLSDSRHASLWPLLLISARIFYLSTIPKEKKSFELETLLIAFILGWLLRLIIVSRIGSEIFSWIFRNIEISYYVREESIHYIGCLTTIVNNFIIFLLKLLFPLMKLLSERNGNHFPNLLIISNIFLIKISLVVLFYSS